ncbi:Flp family type IVb pilin [Seohaeicola saemankumensis]|uniref:Flp family type IVb pilin n=1 Tax=Seohaeicola saemankumensis TaxID=481181 RepID=A0ABW3TB76_9RHOB
MIKQSFSMIKLFGREESGVALMEYLMLLGLLVGSVIGVVAVFGSSLSASFVAWGTWFLSITI